MHTRAVERATADELAHEADVMRGVHLVKEAPDVLPRGPRLLLALGDKLGDLSLANSGVHVEHLEVGIRQPDDVRKELDEARLAAASLAAHNHRHVAAQPHVHQHHLEQVVSGQRVIPPLVTATQLLGTRVDGKELEEQSQK